MPWVRLRRHQRPNQPPPRTRASGEATDILRHTQDCTMTHRRWRSRPTPAVHYQRHRGAVKEFDPERRTIWRVLSELADFGYLEKTETPNGHANVFETLKEPRPAEVDLPDLDNRAVECGPGREPLVSLGVCKQNPKLNVEFGPISSQTKGSHTLISRIPKLTPLVKLFQGQHIV